MKRILLAACFFMAFWIIAGIALLGARPVDPCKSHLDAARQALHDAETIRQEWIASDRNMHKAHERGIQALINYLDCRDSNK
jgi:hypothetical protein